MPVDITIPSPGESITEVTIGTWHKNTGEWVEKDEVLLEIESDKATLEVPSPESGLLQTVASPGEELAVGAVVATIDPGGERPATAAAPATEEAPADSDHDAKATSVARKIAAEQGVDLANVTGSGPGGRITKKDVIDAAAATASPAEASRKRKTAPAPAPPAPAPAAPAPPAPIKPGSRDTRREKRTKLRQRIAERLVESQQTTATLTTFNECDMSAVMALRTATKDAFAEKHGVGLGFMSFFVKASVEALRAFPRVNACLDGSEIEYHDYCDIGVAVGTPKGLVVPVLRNAEAMDFPQIEAAIKDFAVRGRDGKLTVDEMTGGTFTVSNGGVYGSMMSTPILNPPQTGILGMHAIKKRAVEDPSSPGSIVLRPMMYLALSYDHRIIDGTEAVGFLKTIKECIEQPGRLLLDL
ncbi:MAG: 2-oxoglutarate dehydrogenase complex dihydrolipoyllysine-residue succinyltransferase [Phycisphaerales bacterium]|nr:2-oxoglutarate dehydrogenase complex dihydrolipoyllysine-residue succinyltransferase [Phycisphaerales bacterium]